MTFSLQLDFIAKATLLISISAHAYAWLWSRVIHVSRHPKPNLIFEKLTLWHAPELVYDPINGFTDFIELKICKCIWDGDNIYRDAYDFVKDDDKKPSTWTVFCRPHYVAVDG